MIISDFNITQDGNDIQANARVQFEDCDKSEKKIFIKTESKYKDDFFANPHAFLVGCLLPVSRRGLHARGLEEERIKSVELIRMAANADARIGNTSHGEGNLTSAFQEG